MARRGGSGDGGKTSLLSGERVSKTDPRLEACGELDELGSVLGALAAAVPAVDEDLGARVRAVQGDLLTLGPWTAVSPDSPVTARLGRLDPERVTALERDIESWESRMPPLQTFILPGGTAEAAWAHVARTVCRRAERRMVALDPGPPNGIAYLNRLSAWLFSLARWCNHSRGFAEVPWKP